MKEILGITEENLNIPQNEKEAEKETGNDATYGKGTFMKLFRIIFATSNDCNYFDQ